MQRLALIMTIAAISGTANADFSIMEPVQAPVAPQQMAPQAMPPQMAPQPVQAQHMLQPVGPAIKGVTLQQTAATSTLKDTLQKITEQATTNKKKTWKVFADKGLNTNAAVEYQPAGDWKSSLATLATRYNLVFTVDSEKREIKVDQGPGGMRDTALDNQRLSQHVMAPEKPMPVTAPDGRLLLVAKPGQKLSEAVESFLKAGNWKLAWEAGSDIVVSEQGLNVAAPSLEEVLFKALTKFHMHATLYKGNNTVVVQSDSVVD